MRVNKHHMTSAKRGGHANKHNILWMRIERHDNLHHYFGLLRWENIADLIYYDELRSRKKFRGFSSKEIREVLFSIFGIGDSEHCVMLMDRVSRIKSRITRIRRKELSEAA